MSALRLNGTDTKAIQLELPAPRVATPRYFAEYPDATPVDQTTAKVLGPDGRVTSINVHSFRVGGEDYVRTSGALLRREDVVNSNRGLIGRRQPIEIKGVIKTGLVPGPGDHVHTVPCLPVSILRMLDVFKAPPLDEVLPAVKRIADRNEADRKRLLASPPPTAPPASVQAPSAPAPAPTDLKAAVAARIAEQRRAADAASNEADHVRMKLAVAADKLQKLEQSVMEAFMMDTDDERLAALSVIAERLTA